MKRVVRSATRTLRTDRDKLSDLIDLLDDHSVSEHTMLTHFFDYLPPAESIEILKDLAKECDIDLDEEE